MIECCLRNTVEKDISMATMKNAAFIQSLSSFLHFHAEKHTASEPRTWIDGQTFVLVSKT